jgi:hypothetical protein
MAPAIHMPTTQMTAMVVWAARMDWNGKTAIRSRPRAPNSPYMSPRLA